VQTTPAHLDVPDDSSRPAQADASLSAVNAEVARQVDKLKEKFLSQLVVDEYENVYIVDRGHGNPRLLKLGSQELNGLMSQEFKRAGKPTSRAKLSEFVEEMRAEASVSGQRAKVWRRVAQTEDGQVVIALHNDKNTQVWIGPGSVKLVCDGSEVLFYRPPASSSMAVPAQIGDIKLLRKYLNLSHQAMLLYVAWLSYTLAHAKKPGNAFVILMLVGGQGTGKSWVSKLSIRLVDPNAVGVERMPRRTHDLAISSQNFHLLAYDNLRTLPHDVSDALCTMATGGALTARRLYTDDEQSVLRLHAALLLNGIHSFVDQPDLAQRCLPLRLQPIDESRRKSEEAMLKQFESDLPAIQRGLFDLIAKVLAAMPRAQVTEPQRMYGFVQWLAAMEAADGLPAGIYQMEYAALLNEGQLDSLRDNVLGSAVLDFAKSIPERVWTGTPAALLISLNSQRPLVAMRSSRQWPDNEISMSKRLAGLEAALMTQGIQIQFKRGKERSITIRLVDQGSNKPCPN
jgi:hypothetical protein